MNADNRRLLCGKMGYDGPPETVCPVCGEAYVTTAIFTTVPECWDVMQWAFKQEWWEGVYLFAWCRYHEEQHTSGQFSTLHGYIKWLLRDPAHLPEMVLAYGKEVLGWELKEKGE